MENPLYETWLSFYKDATYESRWKWPLQMAGDHDEWGRMWLEQFRAQRRSQRQYAWAVPSPDVIKALAALGPIVEIGAGRGYWGALIQDAGGDIVCYDRHPPDQSENNGWAPAVGFHDDFEVPVQIDTAVFMEVRLGGPEKVLDHPDRALFLCWPPLDDPMAFECLRQYQGETLIYVGEPEGGCTGDDAFHELIREEFHEVECMEIPFWDGLNDALWIYQRSPTGDPV